MSDSWRERLHPVSWWWWAGALALAAVASPPLLRLALALLLALVVWLATDSAGERRTFWWTARFALGLVALRVALQLLLGGGVGFGEPILTLPTLTLPLGVRIGGEVHPSALAAALDDGSALASVVFALGAASVLCHPSLLLGVMPSRLRGFGLLLSAATNFLPALATDASRLKRAARWRGETSSGLDWLDRRLLPLAESALDRSLRLGASIHLRRSAVLQGSNTGWSASLGVLAAAGALLLAAIGAATTKWAAAAAIAAALLARSWWTTRQPTAALVRWQPLSLGFVAISSALALSGALGGDATAPLVAALPLLPLSLSAVMRRD